jgi:hypothetical protein
MDPRRGDQGLDGGGQGGRADGIEAIRIAYTEGRPGPDGIEFPTLEELIAETGADYATARRVSALEHWGLARRAARDALEAERLKRIQDADRRRSAGIAGQYGQAMEELVAAFRIAVREADNPRELAALVRSAPALGAELARMKGVER